MPTLRLSLAATVMLALFCGLSFASVAQSEEASGTEVTVVTGERLDIRPVDETEPRTPEGEFVRWPETLGTFSWSDPRLPAEMRVIMNVVADQVFSGIVLSEDSDGRWSGTWEAFIGDGPRVHGIMRLAGHGAYDGLIAVLHGSDEQCFGCMDYDGIIVEGAMPPMPGLGGLEVDEEVAAIPTKDVVVATQTIEKGTTIGPEVVSLRAVPIDEPNKYALTDPREVVGRVAAIDILEFQVLAPNLLEPPAE